MPEHTPVPSPSRAIYGFAMFLLFKTLFILYVLWAFIPTKFLDGLGLTHLPDKYFALFIPILLLVALTFFVFLVYPSFSLAMTPEPDSRESVTDRYTIVRCQYQYPDRQRCNQKIDQPYGESWAVKPFCLKHSIRRVAAASDLRDSGRIANVCDCPDKRRCLLKKDPSHLGKLRTRSMVPSVADLSLVDVSRVLYRKKI
ncbi:phosphatidylinositol N-acetylglucosaminyltransferase subunit P-like [Uranotaenia lowii]|uniref:phosphatidylinositol N-acetylglucosaminyltransferase subunit P-like n=1 Tax=Uranotaenia lowii TaxID=190385 RepID=UPI002479285B|nr:phosphatidylinositol N-acetylglucosaminyltransferase subunit P-like [Uranotaenia lowii]